MTNKAEGTHLVSEQDKELQITPGLAEVKQGMNADVILPRTGARIDFGDAIYHPENVAHATLYADAHNTYNTCKKLPSALLRERDALQAFKDYVHQRLDEAGIATHPPGEHADAGCRVGQRMDLLVGKRDEAVKLLYEAARYADEVTDSEGATEFAQRVRTFLSALTPDKK